MSRATRVRFRDMQIVAGLVTFQNGTVIGFYEHWFRIGGDPTNHLLSEFKAMPHWGCVVKVGGDICPVINGRTSDDGVYVEISDPEIASRFLGAYRYPNGILVLSNQDAQLNAIERLKKIGYNDFLPYKDVRGPAIMYSRQPK